VQARKRHRESRRRCDGNGESMSIAVGIVLALVVGILATLVGLDRDRALYPVVMIVVASYYTLFALMGGSMQAVIVESAVACVFIGAALAGFKSSLWLVVIGLAAHGVFDLFHPHLYANPGVPAWWPSFCLAYDLVAAGYWRRCWEAERPGVCSPTMVERDGERLPITRRSPESLLSDSYGKEAHSAVFEVTLDTWRERSYITSLWCACSQSHVLHSRPP
jgi:hypothetical protein